MKKTIITILTVVVMLAGAVFFVHGGKEAKAADEIPKAMLDVKAQVATDDSNVIRFVASVDNLKYANAGFELSYDGLLEPKVYTTTTVYEKIDSTEEGVAYEFSPKMVDTTSEYFVTAKLRATAGIDYTVKAFVTTFDNQKIYGAERCVSLSDGDKDTINMMVDFATTSNATYDVYDGDTKIGTAKVIADKNVRITLTDKTVDSFPSATKLTFKNGSTEVGTAIYRNYYTKYTGEGTADTTWYTVDTSADEFIIASSADLYGFADLVNGGTVFSSKTVIQIRNIEVNKGSAGTSAWTAAEGEATHEWMKIGGMSYAFAGTFDGDHNTISGIVDNELGSEDTQQYGLFGSLAYRGLISNVKLANSFFKFTKSNSGAIVGYCQGSLSDIYVANDVYISTTASANGGIVGMYSITTTGFKNVFESCWFAGTITSTKSMIGGIIGRSYRGSVELKNCLFTGTVVGTNFTGGLIGAASGNDISDSGSSAKYNRSSITDCISAGTVKSSHTDQVGSVVGAPGDGEITIHSVYTKENRVYTGTGSGFTANGDATGIGMLWGVKSTNADTGAKTYYTTAVKGVPMQFTNELTGADAYANTGLDFWSDDNPDGVWAAVEGSTPVLKAFASADTVIDTLSGTRTDLGWYYAEHVKTAVDSEWQMVLADASTFELDSAADLYGFSEICRDASNGETFVSDTVKMIADIDLNPGWVPNVNASGVLQNKPENLWIPIGDTSSTNTQFNGAFDGQEHVISGVCVEATIRDAGIFGITYNKAEIRNLQMSNSYIQNTVADYTGAIVGCYRGTAVENIYVDDSVTIYAKNYVGGIYGMHSLNVVRTTEKCWFDGNIYSIGNQVGGIVGRAYAGTETIENCLFSGNITSTYTAGDPRVGGILGVINDNATYTNVIDCVSIGTIKVSNSKYVNSVVGKIENTSEFTLDDAYTTNDITLVSDSSATFTPTTGTIITTKEALKTNAKTILKDLLIKDNGVQNSAWDIASDGTPVLKWDVDGVLRVLLIGNSFCYYHTDELYGMLEAAGIEATVSNVYSSGCPVSSHWSWLNSDAKKYDFITISEDGKEKISSYSLKDCLESEEWDVISLQQHFDPSEAMDYGTASSKTLNDAANLFQYMKANYSEARLLWQQTWSYQVGFKGNLNLTDEEKEAQSDTKKVLTVEKQTLNYEIIRDVAIEICEANDVERVPNGDAWQLARANVAVGDVLCNKASTDYYHDGDVGGGQYLNACGWFEVITGESCLDNTYVPTDYTLSAEKISALKSAAHQAVTAAKKMETENAAKVQALQSVLKGKKVSVIGDSISTYVGYSNNVEYNSTIGGNAVYYGGSNYVTDVNETWWMQVINKTDAVLNVNNSWSGDYATTRGINRAKELDNNNDVAPDIILVYIGVNDFRGGVTEADFKSGYDTMINNMKTKYPNADVFVGTLFYSTVAPSGGTKDDVVAFNSIIKEIGEKYNCTVVDLYNESGINANTLASLMGDSRLHPNNAGMDKMTKCYWNAMYKKYVK